MAVPGRGLRTALLVAVVLLSFAGPVLADSTPTPAPTPGATQFGSNDTKRATFGVQPASVTAPDKRPYLSYDVTPGAIFDDHVAVVNFSLRPVTLSVYATDAVNDDKGGFGLLSATQRPIDAGSWLALGTPAGHGQVTVPARSRAVLPLHLRVPMKATPGDHVGGVLAVLSTISHVKGGVNVRLDQRVATRVYIRVSGPVHPLLVVERIRTTYQDKWTPWWIGRAHITFRVRNAGNVKLAGLPSVAIRGWLGTGSHGKKLATFPLLLPGGHADLQTDVTHVLPEIFETTKITVRPLTLPGDSDPGLRGHFGASASFFAIPWVLLAIVIGLLLLFWWWRRRRRQAQLAMGARSKPAHLKGPSA